MLSNERGFSVLYLDEPSKWSHYCVLDEEVPEYKNTEYVLNIATIILVLSTCLACPLLFVSMYKTLATRANQSHSTKYIIWSVPLAAILFDFLIVINDGFVLWNMYDQYPSQPNDRLYYMYCFMIFFTIGLALLPAINIVTFLVPCTFIKHSNQNNTLPLPSCLSEIADVCIHQRHLNGHYYHLQSCSILFGYVSCSWLLELTAYHIIYIILGTIVTPMETLATLSFIVSAFLCVVIFNAIFLKSISLNYYSNTSYNLLCCIVPVFVTGVLFMLCLGCFMWYFHRYITLVQTYNTSQGIWHVIGSIIPTIFSSIFVLWGKYTLDNLKNDNPREEGGPHNTHARGHNGGDTDADRREERGSHRNRMRGHNSGDNISVDSNSRNEQQQHHQVANYGACNSYTAQ